MTDNDPIIFGPADYGVTEIDARAWPEIAKGRGASMTDGEKRELNAALHNLLRPERPIVRSRVAKRNLIWQQPIYFISQAVLGLLAEEGSPELALTNSFLWPCYLDEDGQEQPIPDYLTFAGLEVLLQAMRERGWAWEAKGALTDGYCVMFWRNNPWLKTDWERADSLPVAAGIAARAALEAG